MNQTTAKPQIYMAPLEGITKFVYRNAHETTFGGIEKYFSPFIDGRINRPVKCNELNDILPENNPNITLIPQIMAKNADGFLATAKQIHELGYNEVNLNLGCPSLTVVRKGKGAGFLAYPEELHQFLRDVFADPLFVHGDMKLSIKTRLGKESLEEMHTLLDIYNEFTLSELILHPRLQCQYYKGTPDLDAFQYVYENSKNSLIYNGDLNTESDINSLMERFPKLHALMIGRGLLRNPALNTVQLDSNTFLQYHNLIFEGYQELLSGETPVLHKMKELWAYWIELFDDYKKPLKALKKSQHLNEYQHQVEVLVRDCWSNN